jgi:metal-responsive CopG/Arc/MetJ family transcriptional regulator
MTISLPEQLAARIESLRGQTGATRSGVIADLLWRGWRDVQRQEREARYRAAYASVADTVDDTAWLDAAAADFFEDADHWPDENAKR